MSITRYEQHYDALEENNQIGDLVYYEDHLKEVERLRAFLRAIGEVLYHRKERTQDDADMQLLVRFALTSSLTVKECGAKEAGSL